MSVVLPKLRVGDPVRHEALAVFPLFAEANGHVEYRLSDEALADEQILVEEVSEGGSVPDLLVENKGDQRVLFLEGEELVGAKQNRILNTSVLVAAHSKIKIPVSCVEQGRWGYSTRHFGASGSHSPSKLRRALKGSVSRSLKEKRGHQSDQHEVWQEVACLQMAHSVESGTGAMSDAFDTYKDRIATYQEKVKYVDGAVGMAVAIGDRVVSVDVFDKPATCEKVWDRMLSGVVFDALEAGKPDKVASAEDVERLIARLRVIWRGRRPRPSVKAKSTAPDSKGGDHASALALDDSVIHGSVMTAV